MADKNCPKCRGTGRVQEKDGSIHTCFDCLQKGELDQHSKNLKDSGIRL
jgi:hypothetical protein